MVIRHLSHNLSPTQHSTMHEGTNTTHPHYPDTALTPVPFGRGARPYTLSHAKTANRNSDESGNEGDDGYEAEMSVAGTETTELESDTNSLSSLTSVD
jgi:hypothetical protein